MWLDYHHSHANWERADPLLPDTCFCKRCLQQFAGESGWDGEALPPGEQILKGELREQWIAWRCGVFTDWVRQFREIANRVRPQALLGTYHCPWTTTERDGALRDKLAIDLKAQSAFLDVFSIMPYHARFGHAGDTEWISRQVAWLGRYRGITGAPGERWRIWPIVQLSDWGERVPVEEVAPALFHGSRLPATGVMAFNWGALQKQLENVQAMEGFYRSLM